MRQEETPVSAQNISITLLCALCVFAVIYFLRLLHCRDAKDVKKNVVNSDCIPKPAAAPEGRSVCSFKHKSMCLAP